MCKAKRKVYLTGIGTGRKELLTLQAEQIFSNCDCIIGATRMIESLSYLQKPTYMAYQAEQIREFLDANTNFEKVAVALSGDTGFYSGAKKLKEELGEYEVLFVPGVSSAVYLAACLQTSWEDAEFISIHGRVQNFVHAIHRNEKTFLLFGGDQCGQTICEKFQHYQLDEVDVFIGRSLSYENECIVKKKGSQLQPEDFTGLAIALVYNPNPEHIISPHLPDIAFFRGKVPMTKEEVRVYGMAKLELTKNAIVYDVGAGTGSVSMEAARHDGNIVVYAIEKNPEAVKLLHLNKQKFRCDNIEIIEGLAPEALEKLPVPTHVFIGGSSGNLKAILKQIREKNPQVRIVLTAISLETLKEAMEAMEEGLLPEAEITQITAARAKKLGNYHMMTGYNPVSIISAGGEQERERK